MSDDTKALIKSAASNMITVLGYISTTSTFLPVMALVRPYLRPLGVVLIIVGIFRGAQSVIRAKNVQLERALLLEDQRQANLRREAEDNEWANKFTRAVQHLSNLVPRFFTGVVGPEGVGCSGGQGYHLVFPDLDLRQRIEAYLIHLDVSHTKMQPRTLPVEQLRLDVVRQTIQQVLDRVDEVKRTDIELARRLLL